MVVVLDSFSVQNEGRLHNDESDELNDGNATMYCDVTMSTDASSTRTTNRKCLSASTRGVTSLNQVVVFGEHELIIRGTCLVLPMDDTPEPSVICTY